MEAEQKTGQRPRDISELVRELRDEATLFFRQEARLAKLEMNQKVSRMTRDGISVTVAGVVLYTGVLILLIAAGFGLYEGLYAAGVSPSVASWLSPLIIGAILAIIGGVMLGKGMKDIKRESMAPQAAVRSIREDREWAKRKIG